MDQVSDKASSFIIACGADVSRPHYPWVGRTACFVHVSINNVNFDTHAGLYIWIIFNKIHKYLPPKCLGTMFQLILTGFNFIVLDESPCYTWNKSSHWMLYSHTRWCYDREYGVQSHVNNISGYHRLILSDIPDWNFCLIVNRPNAILESVGLLVRSLISNWMYKGSWFPQSSKIYLNWLHWNSWSCLYHLRMIGNILSALFCPIFEQVSLLWSLNVIFVNIIFWSLFDLWFDNHVLCQAKDYTMWVSRCSK
jgi:hypothetical protein